MFCGIDWAEQHHDVAMVDETGTRVAKARISNDGSRPNGSVLTPEAAGTTSQQQSGLPTTGGGTVSSQESYAPGFRSAHPPAATGTESAPPNPCSSRNRGPGRC